ncbi:MAG: phasin family protein [Deltaproteobacteria bacterium]|nr:phasin family protein [Deltaproteobacteria bacterium]
MAKARTKSFGSTTLPKIIEENLDRLTDTLNRIQRDAEKLQRKIVRKGKEAEREGRKQVNKLLKEFRKNGVASQIKTARKQVEKQVDEGVTQVFKALNIPERKDVDALRRKVSVLEKQIGTLRRTRRRTARRTSSASGPQVSA